MVRGSVRYAFTLIELIFAIVIMSIVVMSIPVMMQITSKGVENSLVQEAIFAASAELMGASSFYWDNRSIEDINASGGERVVDVDGDCNATRLKAGHILQPFHRRCLDSNVVTGVNYVDANTSTECFSLNRSVHAASDMLYTDINATAAGYKQKYKSEMTISKINNNVKELNCTVTDENNDTLTLLRLFAANIGEADYFKRRF
ncbi:MAG: type II secretion system GspH family protein [Sulfurimonas sp.]|nr:type II secretion system GspH family protein [Sulfurimonas sp.]